MNEKQDVNQGGVSNDKVLDLMEKITIDALETVKRDTKKNIEQEINGKDKYNLYDIKEINAMIENAKNHYRCGMIYTMFFSAIIIIAIIITFAALYPKHNEVCHYHCVSSSLSVGSDESKVKADTFDKQQPSTNITINNP